MWLDHLLSREKFVGVKKTDYENLAGRRLKKSVDFNKFKSFFATDGDLRKTGMFSDYSIFKV